jgi:hypothetical protein
LLALSFQFSVIEIAVTFVKVRFVGAAGTLGVKR